MGVREPLTRLLELMENGAAIDPTCPFLNDERVRECYRELTAIVDAHAVRNGDAVPDTPVKHFDSETGLEFVVKSSDIPENAGRCRSCQALVLWVKRAKKGTGQIKPHPLNQDGTSHFATCPDRDKWRNK